MQFRYGLVAAWVVATIASMLVAFAAVGSVRSAIEDPPSALLLPQTAQLPLSLPEVSSPPQSTVPDPEVDDGTPVASGDEAPGEVEPEESAESGTSSTTQTPPAPPTSAQAPVSTTVPPTTSTTTPPASEPAQDLVETYETEGGWVTLRADDRGVFLESASPKPGWTVDTEGSGPKEFTVLFKADDEEIHVNVSFEHGEVDVDIED